MVDARSATAGGGAVLRAALAGGVDWVQLRERTLAGRALLEVAETVAAWIAEERRRSGRELALVVNRRADIALACGAQGLHLGYDALPLGPARALWGEGRRLGVSTHSPEEVRRAAATGADYVHLAPIWAPLSKHSARPALGLAALRRASRSGVAVLAQGGIDPSRAARAVAAGAAGVAVTGAILGAAAAAPAARRLRRALDR